MNGKVYLKYSVMDLRDMGVPPGLRRYLANPPAADNFIVYGFIGGECLLRMHDDGNGNKFGISGRTLWKILETMKLTKECAVLIDSEWLED